MVRMRWNKKGEFDKFRLAFYLRQPQTQLLMSSTTFQHPFRPFGSRDADEKSEFR